MSAISMDCSSRGAISARTSDFPAIRECRNANIRTYVGDFYSRLEVFCGEPTFCMASQCLNAISTAKKYPCSL